MTDPVIDFAHVMTEVFSEPGKPSQPEDLTTASVLKSMLTENTGRHMLDSGGAYGRAWERNQGVDFDMEPEAWADFRWGYIDLTVSVYHAISEVAEYHAEGDRIFHEWANSGDRVNEGWLPLMEAFTEDIGGLGLYSDGPPMTINTYNGESNLSQVLQYTFFTLEEDTPITDYLDLERPEDAEPVVLAEGAYVLLQIHGGCDVRGGYTQPRLFELTSYEETEFFDLGLRGSFGCDSCDAAWFAVDAVYFEPNQDFETMKNLEDYEWVNLSEPEEFARWTARNIVREVLGIAPGDEDDEGFPALGLAHYSYPSTDTRGFCPHCGTGVLQCGMI